MVGPARDNFPEPLRYKVRLTAGSVAPAAVGPGSWRDALAKSTDPDFLKGCLTGRGRFDGIYISSVPADHADAWRVYNHSTLSRARARLIITRDIEGKRIRSCMLLRVQARAENFASALAVAKTFGEVMGSGMMVIASSNNSMNTSVDILLAGPTGSFYPGESVEGMHVIDLQKFLDRWGDIAPITIRRMGGLMNTSPNYNEFMQWVAQQ